MQAFQARRGDQTWGHYNYPVTQTQEAVLNSLAHVMRVPPDEFEEDVKAGYFCAQIYYSGDVILGLGNHSFAVKRDGTVKSRWKG